MGGEIMDQLNSLYKELHDTQIAFIIVTAIILICCIVIVLLNRYQTKRLMARLNRMLDIAITGNLSQDIPNETMLSQIEEKLSRLIHIAALSKDRIQTEQDRIKALVTDISHQTKTPVSNIVLYTQLLNEQADLSPQARHISTQIESQTNKLNFLIQALIKTSRLESGIIRLQPERENISETITSAVAQCLQKAKAKEITLTYLPLDEAIYATYDSKWVREALYNILDNAIKYTNSTGTISIFVSIYEMFVRIDIKDTGIGIPEEEIYKVFERFWRSSTVSTEEGVGIGLYLSREIITACDGYIKVQSSLGKGSVFSVFLPL